MIVSMIAAMGNGGVLAGPDGIPWDLPRDRKHFREYTDCKPMLLGRRTYEEMDGWFSTQTPIVLTRQSDFRASHVVRSPWEAIELARQIGAEELVVSGGASVYALCLPLADRLVMTHVRGDFEGDVLFPEWDKKEWRPILEKSYEADLRHEYAMRIVMLERKKDEPAQ